MCEESKQLCQSGNVSELRHMSSFLFLFYVTKDKKRLHASLEENKKAKFLNKYPTISERFPQQTNQEPRDPLAWLLLLACSYEVK